MNDYEQINRNLTIIKLLLVAQLLVTSIQVARGEDSQSAIADRQQFAPELWPQLYYVSTTANTPKHRKDLSVALSLVVPSTSRQVVLERCLPVQVSPTLYRLNLGELQWDTATWRQVVAQHPYSNSNNPLVVRADWLLLQLTDAQESAAYYSLLFGKARNRDAVLKQLAIDPTPGNRFGMIEGQSGINTQGKRWIENRPAPRGYAWLTRDSIKLDGESDMLERPDGSFKHDGEEVIIGIRKVHLQTGTQGVLQVYFLANGEGQLVSRAPVELVIDATKFRGLPEIRCPGSCIQCHEAGLNPLKKNEFRDYLNSGVDAYASYENQQALEAFHFADLSREIERNREDYQAIVKLATGVSAPRAVTHFRTAIGGYDRPLSIADAARELQTTPEEFRLALAWSSAQSVALPARVAGLAHGQVIPRTSWEENYLICRQLHADWSKRK